MSEWHICVLGPKRSHALGARARKDMIVHAGFGSAALLRDGIPVLDGERPPRRYRSRRADLDRLMTLREAEQYCRRRPRATWEICIVTPFSSTTWRRVYRGRWVVTESGRGFA